VCKKSKKKFTQKIQKKIKIYLKSSAHSVTRFFLQFQKTIKTKFINEKVQENSFNRAKDKVRVF